MAQIRHIAVLSKDTAALAAFYIDTFGMTLTGVGPLGERWLTDGHIDFAILPHGVNGSTTPAGVHHFGFTIEPDEKDGLYARLAAHDVIPRPPPDDGVERPYVEDQIRDPQGNKVDISRSAVKKDESGRFIAKNKVEA